MSESERDYLTALWTANPLWAPISPPQLDGYLTQADELFYGGAAGGGKSDLLLGLALTQHKRSIIFRREYSQLKALTDRSQELLMNTDSRYNGQQNAWRHMPGDRMLEFGAVQYERDVQKYQGRPHDLIAFDELPNFTRYQYEFLIGWNRTTTKGQRVRVVSAGNPPLSAEGEWVVQLWAPWLDPQYRNPARAGELRWYAVLDGQMTWVDGPDPIEYEGEHIRPKSRTFIPASIDDNPFLLETDYKSRLQQLPEPMRSALLYGDFNLTLQDDPWQVIPTAWVIEAQNRWRNAEQPDGKMDALAADVARGGDDQTILSKRYGNWFAPLEKYAGRDTPDGQSVARLVIDAKGDENVRPAVDVIGVGASAYDVLTMQGIDCVAVNFAEGSNAMDKSGNLKFANKRAEYYWRMREMLDPASGENTALPDDRELRADLCAVRWSMRSTGIQIESKDDVKKRLGRSPDCGDAVVMSAYLQTPAIATNPQQTDYHTNRPRRW